MLKLPKFAEIQKSLLYPPEIEIGLETHNPKHNQILAECLTNTADYFERLADLFASARGSRWGVYEKRKIEQSRIQAQMSEIIIAVDKLYTPELRATLRHIAYIGFAIKIYDKDIDNWRRMSGQGPKTST